MEQNLAFNGYHAIVIRAALSTEPGRMRLTRELDARNHLLVGSSASEFGEEVEVTTLDDVIGDRRVAGVNIDVVGAESLVLGGATSALAEQRIGRSSWTGTSCRSRCSDRIVLRSPSC